MQTVRRAALTIAVAAAIGVGVMIASFREAVTTWLEGTLRADVYVSAPAWWAAARFREGSAAGGARSRTDPR